MSQAKRSTKAKRITGDTQFVIDQATRKDALRVLAAVINGTRSSYQDLRARRGPKAKALADHMFIAAVIAYSGINQADTVE